MTGLGLLGKFSTIYEYLESWNENFIRSSIFFFNCYLSLFRISQLELKQQIESLNEELLKVREALNNHPDLDPYVKKLIACKHKVTVVLNVLQASQVSTD